MSQKSPDAENRLIVDLPAEVAKRLKLAASRQNRAASDVAAELLSKHLPRLEPGEPKKATKIPYT